MFSLILIYNINKSGDIAGTFRVCGIVCQCVPQAGASNKGINIQCVIYLEV